MSKIVLLADWLLFKTDKFADFPFATIDNALVLWLNIPINIVMTLTENSLDSRSSREPAVGVSRYGRISRSDSRVDLVKTAVSNEIRFPPLQG